MSATGGRAAPEPDVPGRVALALDEAIVRLRAGESLEAVLAATGDPEVAAALEPLLATASALLAVAAASTAEGSRS